MKNYAIGLYVLLIVFFLFVMPPSFGQSGNCDSGTVCVFPGNYLKYKITTSELEDSFLTITFGDCVYNHKNMLYVNEVSKSLTNEVKFTDEYILNLETGDFTQALQFGEWLSYDFVYPIPITVDVSFMYNSDSPYMESVVTRIYKGVDRQAIRIDTEEYVHIVDSKTGILLTGTDRFSNYTLIETNILDIKSQKQNTKQQSCKGKTLCVVDKVTRIIDGDTIYTKNYKIRLSLSNSPEKDQKGFKQATLFTKNLCPVGSSILIDQDDKQPYDKYKRVVAKVTCSGKVLNSDLLQNNHANILKQYCSKSEFSIESWAKKYGC